MSYGFGVVDSAAKSGLTAFKRKEKIRKKEIKQNNQTDSNNGIIQTYGFDISSKPVLKDSKDSRFKPSVLFTHVDETDGRVLTKDGEYTVGEWIEKINKDGIYNRFLVSGSHFAEDIIDGV